MCYLILGPMGDTPIIPPSPYNFCFPFFFAREVICQESPVRDSSKDHETESRGPRTAHLVGAAASVSCLP